MPTQLNRDKFFWTVALQTVVVNSFLGGFGPAQSLLRADQGTSLAVAGLHGTAMGLASVAAGLATPVFAHRFGRSNSAWIGMWIFIVGLIATTVFHPVQLTILAAFIAGFGISTVMNTFVTQMNGHFRDKAPMAISQGNGISSIGYVSGTVVVGSIAVFAPNYWRFGMLIAIPLALYLFFVMREKEAESKITTTTARQTGKMSARWWLAWAGFVGSIGTEFSTLFWASALVQDRTGATAAISTVAVMCFGVGMGMGRWYGGRILHRFLLDQQMMIVLTIQIAGFMLLWISHSLPLSLFALFFTGSGVSMQFALQSLRIINLSGGRPDLAIGRSGAGVGLSIGGFPFVLGLLGDNFGISRAYLMVPVAIIVVMILVKLSPSHLSHKALDDLEI